jgi:hypothetical protein
MYPRSQERHRNREATVYLALTFSLEPSASNQERPRTVTDARSP